MADDGKNVEERLAELEERVAQLERIVRGESVTIHSVGNPVAGTQRD